MAKNQLNLEVLQDTSRTLQVSDNNRLAPKSWLFQKSSFNEVFLGRTYVIWFTATCVYNIIYINIWFTATCVYNIIYINIWFTATCVYNIIYIANVFERKRQMQSWIDGLVDFNGISTHRLRNRVHSTLTFIFSCSCFFWLFRHANQTKTNNFQRYLLDW